MTLRFRSASTTRFDATGSCGARSANSKMLPTISTTRVALMRTRLRLRFPCSAFGEEPASGITGTGSA